MVSINDLFNLVNRKEEVRDHRPQIEGIELVTEVDKFIEQSPSLSKRDDDEHFERMFKEVGLDPFPNSPDCIAQECLDAVSNDHLVYPSFTPRKVSKKKARNLKRRTSRNIPLETITFSSHKNVTHDSAKRLKLESNEEDTVSSELSKEESRITDSSNKMIRALSDIFKGGNIDQAIKSIEIALMGNLAYKSKEFWKKVVYGAAILLGLTLNGSLVGNVLHAVQQHVFGTHKPEEISGILDSFKSNNLTQSAKRLVSYILIPFSTKLDLSLGEIDIISISAAEKVDFVDLTKCITDSIVYISNVCESIDKKRNLSGLFLEYPNYKELCKRCTKIEQQMGIMKSSPGSSVNHSYWITESKSLLKEMEREVEICGDSRIYADLSKKSIVVESFLAGIQALSRSGSPQIPPFTTVITSGTARGKSTIQAIIGVKIVQMMKSAIHNLPKEECKLVLQNKVALAGTEKFPGATNETELIVADDINNKIILAGAESTFEEFMIKIKNPIGTPINAAAVHEKNKIIPNPLALVGSSNSISMQAEVTSIEASSIHRRWDYAMRVRTNERFAKEGGMLSIDKVLDLMSDKNDIPDWWDVTVQRVVVENKDPEPNRKGSAMDPHSSAKYWFEDVEFNGSVLKDVSIIRVLEFLEEAVPKYVAGSKAAQESMDRIYEGNLCTTCRKLECICHLPKQLKVESHVFRMLEAHEATERIFPEDDLIRMTEELSERWGRQVTSEALFEEFCSVEDIDVTAYRGITKVNYPTESKPAPLFIVNLDQEMSDQYLIAQGSREVYFAEGTISRHSPEAFKFTCTKMLALTDLYDENQIKASKILVGLDKGNLSTLYAVFGRKGPSVRVQSHSNGPILEAPRNGVSRLYQYIRSKVMGSVLKRPATSYDANTLEANLFNMIGIDCNSKEWVAKFTIVIQSLIVAVDRSKVLHFCTWVPDKFYSHSMAKDSIRLLSSNSLFDKTFHRLFGRTMWRLLAVFGSILLAGKFWFLLLLGFYWSKHINYFLNWIAPKPWGTDPKVYDLLKAGTLVGGAYSIITNFSWLISWFSFALAGFGIGSVIGILFILVYGFFYTKRRFNEIMEEIAEDEVKEIEMRRAELEGTHQAIRAGYFIAASAGVANRIQSPSDKETSSIIFKSNREYYEREWVKQARPPLMNNTSKELENRIENNLAYISVNGAGNCGLFIGTQWILTVKHLFPRQIPSTYCEKLTIRMRKDTKGVQCEFSDYIVGSRIHPIPRKDLVLIQIAHCIPRRSLLDNFPENEPTPSLRIKRLTRSKIGELDIKPGLFKGSAEIAQTATEIVSNGCILNLLSEEGMCGAPIISDVDRSQILAINVGSNGSMSGAIYVTRGEILAVMKNCPDLPTPLNLPNMSDGLRPINLVDESPKQSSVTRVCVKQDNPQIEHLGRRGGYNHYSDKHINKTPISDRLVELGVPRVHGRPLSNRRRWETFERFTQRVAKRKGLIHPHHVIWAKNDFFGVFKDRAGRRKLIPLTMGEVVNGRDGSIVCTGQNLDSGSGHPWYVPKKELGKKLPNGDFLYCAKVRNEYKRFKTMLKNGEHPLIISDLTLKIERLKQEYIGETLEQDISKIPRGFYNTCLYLNMGLAELYGPVYDLFVEDNETKALAETMFGMNPYGKDAEFFYNWIGDWIKTSADISGFDTTILYQILQAELTGLIEIAELGGYSKDQLDIMRSLAFLLVSCIVDVDGDLVLLLNVLGSGCFGTTFLGGMFQSLLKRVHWFQTYGDIPYRSCNKLLTFGDDSIEAFKPVLGIHWYRKYNPASYYEFCKALGIKLTSAEKDSIPGYEKELKMLSRTFGPINGRITARLNLDSIFKQLHMREEKTDVDSLSVLYACVTNACLELTLHGPLVYDEYLRVLREIDHPSVQENEAIRRSFTEAWDHYLTNFSSDKIKIGDPFMGIDERGLFIVNSHVENEAENKPISKIASAVASAAGSLTNIPIIRNYALATQLVSGAIGKIASVMGYSRPAELDQGGHALVSSVQHMSVTNVEDRTKKLTLDIRQELALAPGTVSSDQDPLAIANWAQKEAFLTRFSWSEGSSKDTFLFNVAVDPIVHFVNNGEHYLTPLSGLAQLFEYWYGDLIFTFKVVKPAMVGGSLLIQYDPVSVNELAAELNFQHSYIWNIREEEEVSISVAPSQLTSYMTHMDPNLGSNFMFNTTALAKTSTGNGVLSVRVFNRLGAPVVGGVSATVDILVFIKAGPNFRVGRPTNTWINQTRPVFVSNASRPWQTSPPERNNTFGRRCHRDLRQVDCSFYKWSLLITYVVPMLSAFYLLLTSQDKGKVKRSIKKFLDSMREEEVSQAELEFLEEGVESRICVVSHSEEIQREDLQQTVMQTQKAEDVGSMLVESGIAEHRVDKTIELTNFLSRDVEIYSELVTLSSKTSEVIDPWTAFLNKESSRDKLDMYYGMRADMVFTAILSGPSTMYGQFMIAYIPTSHDQYFPFEEVANPSQQEGELIIASQLPHTIFSASDTKKSELRVEFFHDKEFLDLTQVNEVSNMGRLLLKSFGPLRMVGDTTGFNGISLRILARLENIQFRGTTTEDLFVSQSEPVQITGEGANAKNIDLMYMGETVHSIRSLLKRRVHYYTTEHITGVVGGLRSILELSSWPMYPGLVNADGTHEKVTGLVPYNCVSMTYLSWVRMWFCGVSGSVRWTFVPSGQDDGAVTRVSVLDDITQWTETSTSYGVGELAWEIAGEEKNGYSGTEIAHSRVNPTLDVEVPFQSNLIFSGGRKAEMEHGYRGIRFEGINRTNAIRDSLYVSAGEDIQFYGFVGPPKIKYDATYDLS